MKTVSRVVRIALAGGLVAGAAAVAMPDADAAVKTIGSCSGLTASGKVSPGLGNVKQTLTVSLKGDVAGSCSAQKNGGSAAGAVSKWGAKVTGVTSCINDPAAVDDNPATSYPLNGKIAVTAGAFAFQGYTRVDGFKQPVDPANPTDVVQTIGIVTKGTGVGAQINSELWFTPIVKDKAMAIPTATNRAGYSIDIANAVGCTDTTGATPANITAIEVGDGLSILTGMTADPLTLTIGR